MRRDYDDHPEGPPVRRAKCAQSHVMQSTKHQRTHQLPERYLSAGTPVSGILASGTVVSYEQMILDDELYMIIRRHLRGIEVSDETLALDLIEDIGPGGSFISSTRTISTSAGSFTCRGSGAGVKTHSKESGSCSRGRPLGTT